MKQKARILVIEDDESVAALIECVLVGQDYQVTLVADGESTWKALKGLVQFETILLDRVLPDIDGMDLLRRIKQDTDLNQIPVIIQTGQQYSMGLTEGLANGADYYLTKPLHLPTLQEIVKFTVTRHQRLKSLQTSVKEVGDVLKLLSSGTFHFRTLSHAHGLARTLSNICPDPSRSLLGLMELLINAVEHGNFGITYPEKSLLLMENQWEQEIARRERDPSYLVAPEKSPHPA